MQLASFITKTRLLRKEQKPTIVDFQYR